MEIKNYVVHIGGLSNNIADKDFFIGTGFMGDTFNTYEELKELLYKYASKDNRWKAEYIKLTFELGSTLRKFKEEGDKQCKENGGVNLLSLAFVGKNDPFRNIEVVYRPGGWIDSDGNKFSFCVVEGKDRNITPKQGKLKNVLEEIGIVFN